MQYNIYEGIEIAAISAAVPKEKYDIKALKDKGVDEAFINNFIKNTGIEQICRADFDQTAADIAFSAAKKLEDEGKYNAEEIGVLIFVTQTPDYRTPSTAYALHKRLGLPKECIAFDVNLGCSGFVYGVSLAASLLKNSNSEKALVLIGDTLARGRAGVRKKNSNNKSNTGFLFGDASSAVLLKKDEQKSIYSTLMSDGEGHKALSNPYNAWKHPKGPESVDGDDIAVFNFTIRQVPKTIKAFMELQGTTIDMYDQLVLHQANKMIIKQITKKVKAKEEQVHLSLDRYGNTSGASIPLTIVDRFGKEQGSEPVKFLASGFGIGLSWGVVSFDLCADDIYPVVISTDSYDDGYEEYDE